MGPDIAGVNFLPLATDMRAWLLQQGYLSLVPTAAMGGRGGYTKPYSFSGAALGLIFSRVVNSWHDFINSDNSDEPDAEVDAEVERLRIFNEIVLYTARFCEVVRP